MLLIVSGFFPAMPPAVAMPAMSGQVRLQALVARLRGQDLPEHSLVERINAIFNRIPRVTDSKAWGQQDYWATPEELLKRGQGDCEDVAIAKYFALRKLGVPDYRLRLAYGKIADLQRGSIEAHMVLIYLPDEAPPRVLDSLDEKLRNLSERRDLILEYTFNTNSLWRWQSGSPVLLGTAATLDPWRKLLERL